MQIQKTLTAVNDAIVIDNLPDDFHGVGAVQYGTGGVGTLVVEGSTGLKISGATVWFTIGLHDYAAETLAASIAAAGAAWFYVRGLKSIRVRKTVAGPGDVITGLNIADEN